ncbi:NADH(P)-binding-domain-containing protein [Auriculariales sp. MPI-PUGE-AT-0066]|nr:NADH(P)-binding-domain-containing protein [Auriculariales sp. MPI-PUGE-AT-0066]
MSIAQNVAIIGGAGKVALHLTQILASKGRAVTSVIRNPDQASTIEAAGGKPVVLSLEESPIDEFVKLLEGKDVVVWSAGAGGKGGPERTKAVDHDGALKVFDAIEKTTSKPRLILVSAIAVRDKTKPYPSHYNDEDKKIDDNAYKVIGNYMKWKYEADKNLVQRTAFRWTILRPGGLLEAPGTGYASIGRTHLTPNVPRYDVAHVLSLLVDRADAAGLALDLVGVAEDKRSQLNAIPASLDAAIRKGETDFEV